MLFLAVDDEHLQLNKLIDAINEVAPGNEIVSFNNPTIALESTKNLKIDIFSLHSVKQWK